MAENRAIVFSTPGLLPIEAFTMVGINAKPNTTNPIGFFGTGLKYAIAVLLRLKQEVTIFIGLEEYTFYTKREDFRGKEFEFVYFQKRHGLTKRLSRKKLPFTLEYGKTWKIWQAYRELHTNTLDEGGWIDQRHDSDFWPEEDRSLIIVKGEAITQAFYERYRTFLHEDMKPMFERDGLEVYDKASHHIYYRGMRVHDLPDKIQSKYTYNFISHVDLTEDRTAKYAWDLESRIARNLVLSEDRPFVESCLKAPEGTFEKKLNYNFVHDAPSAVFTDLSRRPYARSTGAYLYSRSFSPPPKAEYDLRAILQTFVDLPGKPDWVQPVVEDAKKYLDGTYEWDG